MLLQHLNAFPQRGADGCAARIIDEQRTFRNVLEQLVQIGKRVPIDPVEAGNSLICSSWLALNGFAVTRGASARIMGVGVSNQSDVPLS